MLSEKNKQILLTFQKNEIAEYHVYLWLARRTEEDENKETLKRIANEELRHYEIWKKYTKQEIRPSRRKIFKYTNLAKILGVTFAVKLMEQGEKKAQDNYGSAADIFPEARQIIDEEHNHERELAELVKEKKLDYMGSIVLGLNDALVELTGALAGLSFALQNTKLIALAGLVTGIAASFSMAASKYLSAKAENDKNPLKSSTYTGIAYIFTVAFLVFPFLILSDYRWALSWTIANAITVIAAFTYFSAVIKDLKFKTLFSEMFFISMGIAAISLIISVVLKKFLGIET